jgi:hypothetical protein
MRETNHGGGPFMATEWWSPARGVLAGALTAAVLAALAAGAIGSGSNASAATAGARALSPKALAFHDAMRALWEIHGTYTERAIVDAVGGLPDTKQVVARLLRNQVDIGNAVKPYYGAAAGRELTTLLKAHIDDAVATVLAAKSGDASATAKAKAEFYANGRQVAAFLHEANPSFWSLGAMQSMMRMHLDQVVGLAVDQIEGRYGAAIKLYDVYIDHILVGMADMLSDGIMKQFPDRFA